MTDIFYEYEIEPEYKKIYKDYIRFDDIDFIDFSTLNAIKAA